MKKYEVIFQGGESARHPGEAANFMMVDIDDTRLYSEVIIPDECTAEEAESYGYDELVADITAQTAKIGVAREDLSFWYD